MFPPQQPRDAHDLADLVLCDETGFTPGTTFTFDGLTWQRQYAVVNTLRQATSGRFLILEQSAHKDGSRWPSLLWPNHYPHDGCDGSHAHRILWVYDSTRRGNPCVACILDGWWYSL